MSLFCFCGYSCRCFWCNRLTHRYGPFCAPDETDCDEQAVIKQGRKMTCDTKRPLCPEYETLPSGRRLCTPQCKMKQVNLPFHPYCKCAIYCAQDKCPLQENKVKPNLTSTGPIAVCRTANVCGCRCSADKLEQSSLLSIHLFTLPFIQVQRGIQTH